MVTYSFLPEFMDLLYQMGIFFILILLGWIARKYGMMDADNQKQISRLLVNMCAPSTILLGAFVEGEKLPFSSGIQILLFFFAILLVLMAVSEALARILRFPVYEQGAVVNMTLFTNVVFMGLPLIDALYGPPAIVYFSLFLIVNNLLMYSYGYWAIGRGASSKAGFNPRLLINPGVIAAVSMLFLYFLDIRLPDLLMTPLRMVGGMTAPLGMMIIGATMKDVNFLEFLKERRVVVYTVLKMVVIPVVFVLGLKCFTSNTYLIGISFVIVAAPAAALNVVFAVLFNKAAEPFCTAVVTLTTGVSLLSIPLVGVLTGI